MAQHFLLSTRSKDALVSVGAPHDGRGKRRPCSRRFGGLRQTASRSAPPAAALMLTSVAVQRAACASVARLAGRISASRRARCSPRTSCRCAATLAAIAIFCNEVKGKSMLAFLSRSSAFSYKAAFVLAHKLRESDGGRTARGRKIGGEGKEAEIDGGYFRRLCEARQRERVPQRPALLAQSILASARVVVVIRERNGNTPSGGLQIRKPCPVFHSSARASRRARPCTPDEAGAWNDLHSRFELKRINHKRSL